MPTVKMEYCASDPSNNSFFHFYLYQVGGAISLNWTMSRQISCQIWAAMSERRYKDENTREPNPNVDEAKMMAQRLAPGKTPPSGDALKDLCQP